ncbi:MFS transporter [Paenibacillus sp. CN-4]|uniref:MFS transporter n=1 Tax=Paenibacillus nanchangensis TaxID=3348343 RepID=UPI00397835B9
MADPIRRQQLHRRTLLTVAISQVFGGAGLTAGITVGALLAQEMTGNDRLTGLPTAVFTIGSAAASLLVGRLSQRNGRRTGLAAGFITGGIGAVGVVLAALSGSLPLLCLFLLLYGAGAATNMQARYAGTDLAEPDNRAKAVSMALVSTTFGAVAGPNLVEPTGRLAAFAGLPPLTGPFLLAAAAYICAGLICMLWLKPDPLLVAKSIATAAVPSESGKPEGSSPPAETSRKSSRGLTVGATVMVLNQLVMVAIMTMTPIHMKHAGHGLHAVGWVIALHVGAMYLPSLVTGYWVDRIGRTRMAMLAALTLLAAGLTAAFAPTHEFWAIAAALILLGLGWNFGLISGTALIVDATTPSNRAKVQGSVDVFVALSGAAGGATSGMIAGAASFSFLSISGGLAALLLLPIVLWSVRSGSTSEQRSR